MKKLINNISDIRTLIIPAVREYELKISDNISLFILTGSHADSAERGTLEVHFHANDLREDMVIDYLSPEKARNMVKSMRNRLEWGYDLKEIMIVFRCYQKGLPNKIDIRKAPTHVYMKGWGSQEMLQMMRARAGEEKCYMLFIDLGQEYFSDNLTLANIKELAIENKYKGDIYVYVRISENEPGSIHWFVAE